MPPRSCCYFYGQAPGLSQLVLFWWWSGFSRRNRAMSLCSALSYRSIFRNVALLCPPGLETQYPFNVGDAQHPPRIIHTSFISPNAPADRHELSLFPSPTSPLLAPLISRVRRGSFPSRPTVSQLPRSGSFSLSSRGPPLFPFLC